ncbi:MAG: flagellar hook-length control protein FliK [Pseudomonadota bacterium]
MSPVSPASLPKQPAGAASPLNPEPFVMTVGKDGQMTCGSGKTTGAQPDGAIPVADPSTPVPAAELVAALDLAARTTIAPAKSDAESSQDPKDPADASADAASSATLPVLLAQAPVPPANPFAALIAAAPVVVQAIVADTPQAADDGVQAAKLPDAKTASRSAGLTDVPASKPADPGMAALFAMAKDMARKAESASTASSVEVSVTMLSDTASDADTTPTFSLPSATAALHQLASASSTQPVVSADVMINRHLDLARGDAWLDTLAKDIAASAGTGDRMRFALQPEHLGKLDVEVSRHDTGVAVHMTTRSEEARAIIAAAQPRLIDELRANGTRVVAADVASQMNAQTNGQSGNASRRPMNSFIEAAIDVRPSAATQTNNTAAAGRYA